MTPAAAHRLLTASTDAWIAYQKDNPTWGQGIAQCLRAQAISPLTVTNNLRKLTDCLAHPDIEPLLSAWIQRNFVPQQRASNATTPEDRLQEGISRCVRSLQLQAVAQRQYVNILPKLDALLALCGAPCDAEQLVHHWTLTEADVYTLAHRPGEYFSNGRLLGGKAQLKKALAAYHQQFASACTATPALVKAAKNTLQLDSTYDILGEQQPLAPTMLWEQGRLLNYATKLTLAYAWANDTSPWATRKQDESLSPEKTKHWKAWAHHAETYLVMTGEPLDSLNTIHKILKTCPPMPEALETLDDLDKGVFMDAS